MPDYDDLPDRDRPTMLDRRADVLFDLLCDADLTSEDIMASTGWDKQRVFKVVQRLRDRLADTDITVACDPQGYLQPWLYHLLGGGQVVDGEHTGWVPNRITDTERRLKTMTSVLSSAVAATDGRSLLGRKARVMKVHLERASQDLDFINNGPMP